jgi:hypothetical protein
MTTERLVRIVAGLMIILTAGLGIQDSPFFHSPYWLWFTAFIGLNLLQSGFTRFCPLDMILRKLGVPAGGL